jgi:hypothetical protein
MIDSFGLHEVGCCIGTFLPMQMSHIVPPRYVVNLDSFYTVQAIL